MEQSFHAINLIGASDIHLQRPLQLLSSRTESICHYYSFGYLWSQCKQNGRGMVHGGHGLSEEGSTPPPFSAGREAPTKTEEKCKKGEESEIN